MPNLLWRILIAVICVVLLEALLPPVLRLLGFTAPADLLVVVRVCVAGLAIFYVLGYPRGWWGPANF